MSVQEYDQLGKAYRMFLFGVFEAVLVYLGWLLTASARGSSSVEPRIVIIPDNSIISVYE